MMSPGKARLARGLLKVVSAPGDEKDLIVDVRGAQAHPAVRAQLVAQLICEFAELEQGDLIACVSRGGVPLGCQMAALTGLPAATVLPDGPRTTGLKRAVEGDIVGRQCVLVDNAVTTGGSLLRSSHWIRQAGGQAVGALVVTRYGADEDLVSLPFPLRSLFTWRDLVALAADEGLINVGREIEVRNASF